MSVKGTPLCGGANMPSEQKVGPKGAPWHLEQNGGQLQVLTADKELVAVLNIYGVWVRERKAWKARWRHAISCVNAMHAAGLTPEQVESVPELLVKAQAVCDAYGRYWQDDSYFTDVTDSVNDLRVALARLRRET